MLVEHDRTYSALVKEALEKENYRVRIAENGAKALEMYLDKKPDLLITNVPLPLMNGLELVIRIRRYNKRMPIVFLSDLKTTDDAISGYNAGGNEYLRKPMEMAELMLRIRVLLESAAHWGKRKKSFC
ncbi:hypothetical protein AGMMS50262_22590 [Bacteroidia bacterium]|nr:hypothetical protein AGMMS50262_22590 [Bacteroidia bacterium]